MFALGQVWIGNYKVWITTPVFTIDPLNPKSIDLEYYSVSVAKIDSKHKIHYYINLMEDDKFRVIFNVNEKRQPTLATDMIAYNDYLNNRSMQMPLWKLSKNSIEQLFQILLGDVSHPPTPGA